jgi:hypothetical protein
MEKALSPGNHDTKCGNDGKVKAFLADMPARQKISAPEIDGTIHHFAAL